MLKTGLVSGLLVLLTACSQLSAQEADIPMIEQQIVSGVKDQSGVSVTVECPETIEWEVGRTFNCVVEAGDGSRAMAEVTMENEDGEITWQTGQ